MISIFLVALTLTSFNAQASEPPITFPSAPGFSATLRVERSAVTFAIKDSNGRTTKGIVNSDTENRIHIVADNYTFDNQKGFSIWSLDEGKGTYTIHRIFTFSKREPTFKEARPACGDEFINLRVDRKNRRLISTYFKDNVPTRCITHLPRSTLQ